MAIKHLIFTAAATLYGKTTIDSLPWGTDAVTITEDATYPGVYPATTVQPFIFQQLGASPDAADTFVGDIRSAYYGFVSDGDLYMARRSHNWDWQSANLSDKLKALYSATDLIEKFNFIGTKTVSTQTLAFPRTRTLSSGIVCQIGATTGVPPEIVKAIYLIADALLGGRDPQADFEAQNVKVETFGPVRTEFATDKGPMQHIANLIPSPSAWALILPFLGISTSFSVNKG